MVLCQRKYSEKRGWRGQNKVVLTSIDKQATYLLLDLSSGLITGYMRYLYKSGNTPRRVWALLNTCTQASPPRAQEGLRCRGCRDTFKNPGIRDSSLKAVKRQHGAGTACKTTLSAGTKQCHFPSPGLPNSAGLGGNAELQLGVKHRKQNYLTIKPMRLEIEIMKRTNSRQT